MRIANERHRTDRQHAAGPHQPPGRRAAPRSVVAKLEFFNPAHSVKDRIGVAMIDAARGRRQDQARTRSCSSRRRGNTGIALAMVCAARGYQVRVRHARDDEPRTPAAAQGLRRRTHPDARPRRHDRRDPQGAGARRGRSALFHPAAVREPRQPGGPPQTTAEEIWRDTDGKVDIFVVRHRHRRHDHRRRRGAEGAQAGRASRRRRAGRVAGALGRRRRARTRSRASAPASCRRSSTRRSTTR